ncbi:MAG: hypothetical protein M1338_01055 [Patescibacteria group bacterium]|nr:hypothetical protein [Patescibacteria group bacterium]
MNNSELLQPNPNDINLNKEPLENNSQKEISKALLEYGWEHYQTYTTIKNNERSSLEEIIRKANEDSDRSTKIDPNLIERANKLLIGQKDAEIEAAFVHQNTDLNGLLCANRPDEKKRQKIINVFLKNLDYNNAVMRSEKQGIEFSGFEQDSDLYEAKNYLHSVFSQQLLDKCLISKISYQSEIVLVGIKHLEFLLPLNKYQEWKGNMPQVQEYKFRARNLEIWNDFTRKYMTLPIYLYRFIDENPKQLNYLKDVPEQEKMRLYKIGTICHEIGHNIYYYLMDETKRSLWRELINKDQIHLTQYSKQYTTGTWGKQTDYSEEFAEAIRLKTTVPQYLQEEFSKLNEFLILYFPEINKSRS